MFGFVSERRHKAVVNMGGEYVAKYLLLLAEWNALMDRINELGGEAFLRGDVPHPKAKAESQFTAEEIDRLIRLCHPDKHGGSEAAKVMTQKLLLLRSK